MLEPSGILYDMAMTGFIDHTKMPLRLAAFTGFALGEYIGAIWTQVKNKPLVVEEERINFSSSEPEKCGAPHL